MAFRLRQPALASAALVAFASFAVPSFASDTPPPSLYLVGDHWTAWSPPAEMPPDAKVHIVDGPDEVHRNQIAKLELAPHRPPRH